MVQANRALAFNTGDKFVPTTLDEAKGQVHHPESCTTYSPVVRRATGTLDMLRGASHRPDTWQVPVFYSEKVALSDAKGGTRYPFFFRKEDLDQARDACAVGRVPLLLMDAVQCLTQSYSARRTPRL